VLPFVGSDRRVCGAAPTQGEGFRPCDLRKFAVQRPKLSRTTRVLEWCVTIDDLRREACRLWPRGVRGYVDGGAEGEQTLKHNRDAFGGVVLGR